MEPKKCAGEGKVSGRKKVANQESRFKEGVERRVDIPVRLVPNRESPSDYASSKRSGIRREEDTGDQQPQRRIFFGVWIAQYQQSLLTSNAKERNL